MKTLAKLPEFVRRHASAILGLGLLLLLIQDVFGAHGIMATRRSQTQAAAMSNEIGQIETENSQLEDRVKALKSDPAAIERIARDEMGLAKPGEYIFKLPAKPSQSANQPEAGDSHSQVSTKPQGGR